MINFNELNIKPTIKAFEGDKIKMERIINKKIIVDNFRIEESKFKDKGSGKLLTLQIIVDNAKRVVFTGSGILIQMIEQVPKDKFPFQTTIIKENDGYQFT